MITRAALRDQRKTLPGWALAVAGVATLYTVWYPTIGTEQFEVMLNAMPEFTRIMGLDAMISAAGYVNTTVYSLLGAVVVLVFAIGSGARLVAGEEQGGNLELDFAAPVTRERIYLERLAVLWLGVLVLLVAITVTLLVLTAALDLDLSAGNLVAASVSLLIYAGTLGTLAFGIGAATGRRGVGLAWATSVAVLAHLLNYLAPLAKADWMETISPFSWYIGDGPVLHGFNWPGLALLLVLAVAAAVGGLLRFRRRDLMV